MYKYLTEDQVNMLKDDLITLLDRRFAHRDFSILNKRWKGIHIDNVAAELLLIIDMEIQRTKESLS